VRKLSAFHPFERCKLYFDLSATLGNTSGLAASSFRFDEHQRTIPEDREDAVRNVKLAASRGNALGQLAYGAFLIGGRGVAKDAAEGLRFAKLAADQGNPLGQSFYVHALAKGIGTDRNGRAAGEYLKELTQKGSGVGLYLAGEFLNRGWLFDRNEARTAKFFKLSARQRCPFAIAECARRLLHTASQASGDAEESLFLAQHYLGIARSIGWSRGTFSTW
jgi:TPR repeat protein